MDIALLKGLAVGAPTTHNGVTVFPILGGAKVPDGISIGSEGITVSELESAEVPTLLVTNTTDQPILLLEGEVLEGGQQTRTLNVSVLVPAGTSLEVPVTCVEAGRWRGTREFSRTRYNVSRQVRRAKHAGVYDNVRRSSAYKMSDQRAVWGQVDLSLDMHAALSSTSSFEAAQAAAFEDNEDRQRATDELIEAGPADDQTGVVVAVGGKVVSAEVFGSPELLKARWEQIVRSLMFESGLTDAADSTTADAEAFLRLLAEAEVVPAPGVGIGEERHLRSEDLVAQALVLDDALVHASVFSLVD
jgi:hypothetical protein